MPTNRRYDIFISYRRVGGFETAQLLSDRLTKLGYRVFFDLDTMRSGDFSEQIYEVIEHCNDVVVIVNPGIFDRAIEQQRKHVESGADGSCPPDPQDWVRLEVAYAFEKQKNVVPMFLRNATLPDASELPADIALLPKQNGCEASHEHFNSVVQRLQKNLRTKPRWRHLPVLAVVFSLLLCLFGWAMFRHIIPDTVTMNDVEDKIAEIVQSATPVLFKDIFEAAEKGTVRDVQYFIEKGADVNAQDKNGYTPLHRAASDNPSVDVLKFLIDNGANVTVKSKKSETPLHCAAWSNPNVDVMKFLIKNGADVNEKVDGILATPLHLAAQNNPRVDILKLLIETGGNVNAKDNNRATPLHVAVLYNRGFDMLKFLIDNGADVNAQDKDGCTPLHHAASDNPSVDVLKFLIDNGADVNTVSEYGAPLNIATVHNNVDVIRVLLDSGADINVNGGKFSRPLLWAVSHGNVESVEYLIERGADVNGKYPYILSVFDIPIAKEMEEIIRAAVNRRNGWTPLHFAAQNISSVDDMKSLVKNGAEVNAKNKNGETPLHIAAKFNHNVDVLKSLVKNGAEVNAKNKNGETPLHWAAAFNSEVEIVEYLISQGADVNAKDEDGDTPLYVATAYNSEVAIIKYLVSQGTNINVQNNKGKTPLDMAKDKSVKAILREAGGKSGKDL